MLVLFDIDDTLIDHSTAVRAGVAALHAEVRPATPLAAFHAAWVDAMKEHFPKFLRGDLTYDEQRRARLRQTIDARLTDAEADALFPVYFRAYEAGWSLFPDVLACLESLAGHSLGIISNGNSSEQRAKLACTGITDRFDVIHISDECGHAKPAAEIFHRACRSGDVSVRDAIYVGDLYEIDAVGARQAGLHGVWLNRGAAAGHGRMPPMIGGLSELLSFLESLPP